MSLRERRGPDHNALGRFSVRRIAILIVSVAALAATAGCSDSGSGLTAAFAPAARTPGAGQVWLDGVTAQDDRVGVAIRVRDVTDVADVELYLAYDPDVVVFRSWEPGTLLEQGGAVVTYDVRETVIGTLRIDATRSLGGADAGSDGPALVVLSFRLAKSGSSPISFLPTSKLSDGAGLPIAGVAYYGGTLAAQ